MPEEDDCGDSQGVEVVSSDEIVVIVLFVVGLVIGHGHGFLTGIHYAKRVMENAKATKQGNER